MSDRLAAFVTESNRIEGILREPTQAELDEAEAFIRLPQVSMAMLRQFVGVYQPDAMLRDRSGLNVRVGSHVAPPGGPMIPKSLRFLVEHVNELRLHPHQIHCEYETLHPFTDCNGRSGRILWLWMMMRLTGAIPAIGFLHTFYYQTLERLKP